MCFDELTDVVILIFCTVNISSADIQFRNESDDQINNDDDITVIISENQTEQPNQRHGSKCFMIFEDEFMQGSNTIF